MELIYLDNYRGFSNCMIELKDVNFLVGENSTGKSSVMAAIKLLYDFNFWLNHNFNSDPIQLGYYKDIVSRSSNSCDYFTLGFAQQTVNKKTTKTTSVLMKFTNNFEAPAISEFVFYINGEKVIAKVCEKQIRYVTQDTEPIADLHSLLSTLTKDIKNEFPKKFKTINVKQPKSIYLCISLISKDIFSQKMEFNFFDFIQFHHVSWIAPIRTKPKSIYEGYRRVFSPEGEHAPLLLNDMIGTTSKKSKITHQSDFEKSLNQFGESSGLYDMIKTKKYGKSKTSPFEVQITLNESDFNISNVGCGVSQILPILIDSAFIPNGFFAIQQPEVHLHPKAQAALGEYIYDLVATKNKKFLIETHSDYIVDRFRLSVKKASQKKKEAQILFFKRTKFGNSISSIGINKDGKFSGESLDDYRSFFIKEQMDLLDL
ncbi:MAG: AAA family ATPase [Desulfovibrionaceae bacterium]|nr:AAA family ATPase [Desulfovibrionaceae bacterium]